MLDSLEYFILNTKIAGHEELIDQHNSIYSFWTNIWNPTLKKMKLPPLDKDQILRQNYICYLKSNDSIIATHFYTKYDLRANVTKDCSYFKDSYSELKQYCSRKSINTLMTQEYLSVHPEWRKLVTGFSIPELMIGLAIKMIDHINCDSTVGTIREGAPSVERISKAINADLLPLTIQRYNMNHKLFIASKQQVQMPGSFETKRTIEELWKNKTEFHPTNTNSSQYIKKSA